MVDASSASMCPAADKGKVVVVAAGVGSLFSLPLPLPYVVAIRAAVVVGMLEVFVALVTSLGVGVVSDAVVVV
jgi:hypothetical protein